MFYEARLYLSVDNKEVKGKYDIESFKFSYTVKIFSELYTMSWYSSLSFLEFNVYKTGFFISFHDYNVFIENSMSKFTFKGIFLLFNKGIVCCLNNNIVN